MYSRLNSSRDVAKPPLYEHRALLPFPKTTIALPSPFLKTTIAPSSSSHKQRSRLPPLSQTTIAPPPLPNNNDRALLSSPSQNIDRASLPFQQTAIALSLLFTKQRSRFPTLPKPRSRFPTLPKTAIAPSPLPKNSDRAFLSFPKPRSRLPSLSKNNNDRASLSFPKKQALKASPTETSRFLLFSFDR